MLSEDARARILSMIRAGKGDAEIVAEVPGSGEFIVRQLRKRIRQRAEEASLDRLLGPGVR